MDKKKYLKILREFKKRISVETPISKMFLFGSRVSGKEHQWSDFDLLIVSSKFNNIPSHKRGIEFYDSWSLDSPVDFLCYSPEEFNKLKNQITIVREAVENGVEI